MEYSFSLGWFALGLLVFIAGGAITFFYRAISDNMVNGVSSYEKVKLAGIIISIVGLLLITNLHTLLLSIFVSLVFQR